MIKIQGIAIESPASAEGLADLIESMADPDCAAVLVAEKLFGLLVLMEKASNDDRHVIIERAKYFAYIHTEQGRKAIKAMSETILDS